MAILAGLVVCGVLGLLLHFLRKRAWRRAEHDVARRLTLGDEGVITGAQSIFQGGHGRAVLLLHGFGDTPQSLRQLAARLAEAGWTVSVPLLPGHGRTLVEFNASGSESWLTAAQGAFDALAETHDPVIVCGQSMGAALAISLAARRSIPGVALLAPYVSVPQAVRWTAAMWPVVQLFAPLIKTRDPQSVQDREAAERSLAYGYVTPRVLAELWKVVRGASGDVKRVRSATLVIHSREDNRVSMSDVRAFATRIQAPVKDLHWVTGCGHVITVDYCKERVAALVVEWLERRSAPQGTATTAR